MDAQCENIDKRIKVLEVKGEGLKQEALDKKRKKDTRGAVMALKKKKMYEKELAKLDGMKILMENEKMAIESSVFNKDVFKGLQEGHQAVKQLQKQANMDEFEKLKDEIEEQQAELEEQNEFFANIAKDEEDDLLEELDELEAEMVEEQMEGMDVGAGPVNIPN